MTAVERLDEIEARAAVATDGPWHHTETPGRTSGLYRILQDGYEFFSGDQVGKVLRPADAEFISHARADIPWLVEQVRIRDAAIKAVLALHQRVHSDPREHDCTVCRQLDPGQCDVCGTSYPCPTVRAITAALDVTS